MVEYSRYWSVSLDMSYFRPEEIQIKIVNGQLSIEAIQWISTSTGDIEKKFIRTLSLPESVQLEQSESNLSRDGILSITIPKKMKYSSSDREFY